MDEATNALTHRIIGLAMHIHTRLGPGLLEQACKHCLCHEFDQDGIPTNAKSPSPWVQEGTRLECGYRADLIVANRVLLELKSLEHILPLHEA